MFRIPHRNTNHMTLMAHFMRYTVSRQVFKISATVFNSQPCFVQIRAYRPLHHFGMFSYVNSTIHNSTPWFCSCLYFRPFSPHKRKSSYVRRSRWPRCWRSTVKPPIPLTLVQVSRNLMAKMWTCPVMLKENPESCFQKYVH